MKTQFFSKSNSVPASVHSPWDSAVNGWSWASRSCAARLACEAIQQYKSAIEESKGEHNVNLFPSCDFETLKIKNSSPIKGRWPDDSGRYWWQLTLEDGHINEHFYWTKDEIRGYPDKEDYNRYWFNIHNELNDIKIEGLSWEADRDRGYPDDDDNFWSYVRYTPLREEINSLQEKRVCK